MTTARRTPNMYAPTGSLERALTSANPFIAGNVVRSRTPSVWSDGSSRKRRTLLRSQRTRLNRWSVGSITGRENVSDLKHPQRSLDLPLLHLLVESRQGNGQNLQKFP